MDAQLFQTLADPTRLRILEALRGGEQAVNDLAARFELHQSGVSRHLRVLAGAGFVRARPEGPRRLYELRPEPFRELEAWVDAYRALWDARLDRLGRALESRGKPRRAGEERSRGS